MTKKLEFGGRMAAQVGSLAMAAALCACGGGGGAGDGSTAGAAVAAVNLAPTASISAADPTVKTAAELSRDMALDQGGQLVPLPPDVPAPPVVVASPSPVPVTMPAAAPVVVVVTSPPAPVAAEAVTLANLAPVQRVLVDNIRASNNCAAAFVPPGNLVASAPVALASSLTMDAADIQAAAAQLIQGPFRVKNDYRSGSPDEMSRLLRNQAEFERNGESAWTTATDPALRATHGTLARDSAFVHLLQPNAALLAKVKSYLLAQANEPLNDFSAQVCIRALDRSMRDAAFGEASWLARYLVTYDAVRQGLSAADRLTIENFIRRNAYFLAAQQDYGFNYLFPQRASGNYVERGASAAAINDTERWLYKRYDTNDDCAVDSKDDATSFAAYTHANADGTTGPRLSVLSQWYNNRKSISALAMGSAGLLLGDSELIVRAKRYFMEWLTYSVYGDGSEGEYARNGDYCVANQGVVYAHSNVHGAALLADMLARKGDNTLLAFRTRDGLFGTESATGQAAKSIEGVIATHLQLATGQLAWYEYRGDRVGQSTLPAQHLGRMDANIYKATKGTDGYHQLGLLLVAKRFPNQAISDIVLRIPAATTLRWPGDNGNAVATGFGSWAGAWTDVMNVYPSALMLRAK